MDVGDEDWGIEGTSERAELARVIYGSMVAQARAQAAAADTQLPRIRAVFDVAKSETDRSAAVLIFALVEDLILSFIKARLDGQAVKGGWSEITGGNGLLATASDRMTIISIMRWITPDTYHDLRLLKSIRNRFAHHSDANDFDDNQIQSWMSAIKKNEQPIIAALRGPAAADYVFPSRAKFLMRAALIITATVLELAVGPPARQLGVSPEHVEGATWAGTPENLRELRRLAADVLLWFLPALSSK